MKTRVAKMGQEDRARAAAQRDVHSHGWREARGHAAQQKQQRAMPPGPFRLVQKKPNQTGMSDAVKTRMETALNADFSDVRIHPESSQAPAVGALAYTQGSDIHLAPGQFRPDTAAGASLLGHELAHVVQQREGRVRPTTEVAGMPVNDDPALEHEADVMGSKVNQIVPAQRQIEDEELM